jgi:hypothetical protein
MLVSCWVRIKELCRVAKPIGVRLSAQDLTKS